MATSPMPAAQALATLQAAGVTVTRATRATAARLYGCQTAVYVINGRGVNLGRLRQLALEAQAAQVPAAPDAVIAHLCRKFPVSTPATYQPAVARLQARGAVVTPGTVLRELGRGPVLPGETTPPPAPSHGEAAPTLPELRADAAAGRPVSLAAVARAQAVADRPAPTGEGWAGQPWDPGTPAARAAVALQDERAAILWPIAQACRGEGVALPSSWAGDGPALNGEWCVTRALSALPLGAIAAAARRLEALPPVTVAQDCALALCRGGAVPGRPYL